MRSTKTGVLLVNLGTPDSPTVKDVKKYLTEFLMDGRVIDLPPLKRSLLVRGIIAPFRSKKVAREYQKLWTPMGSPLLVYGNSLAQNSISFLVKMIPLWNLPCAIRVHPSNKG